MKRPTRKQKQRFSYMIEHIGCISCLIIGENTEGQQAEIHHAMGYGRRNHDKIYPLCHSHHRTGNISRHGTPKEFIDTFGDDEQLVKKAYEIIGESIEYY